MAKPLTKCSTDGKLYKRPPSVEAALDALLREAVSEIVCRAAIGDANTEGYVRTECLVHLARDAGRRGDDAAMNALVPCVFKRSEIIVLGKYPGGLAAELSNEVTSSLGIILADGMSPKAGDKLDFFEANFHAAITTLIVDCYRKLKRHRNRFKQAPEASEDAAAQLPEEESKEQSPLEAAEHSELCEAIDALPPELRKAYVLHYVQGLKIESADPNITTVAKLMKVRGRTVQNYLARAAKALARFSEDK
jgi:DNA-directed RNA polymerase specialized sigma24 family protein